MSDSVEQILPGIPIDKNEPTPTPGDVSGAPDKTSIIENIKRATKGVFEHGGILYKRMGKPRTDGKPGKRDVPLTAPTTALPLGAEKPPANTAQDHDSAIVRKCIKAVVKAWRGFADKFIFKKALKAGYNPIEAQELVSETTVTNEEADAFTELAEICFRKYGVGTQYCPEIGACAVVAGVGFRFALTAKALNARIEQNEKREAMKEAA